MQAGMQIHPHGFTKPALHLLKLQFNQTKEPYTKICFLRDELCIYKCFSQTIEIIKCDVFN